MRRRLMRWELFGFLLTAALGTVLHFVYDWTRGSPLAAIVSATNESTWEHMKLLFVPVFLFTIAAFFVFADPFRNFLAVQGTAVLLGLTAIPVLFYTLNGAFGKTPDWINIGIFFLADALVYFTSYRLLTRGALRAGVWQVVGFLLFWLLAFLFLLFTYRPPELALFRDPTNGLYGLQQI